MSRPTDADEFERLEQGFHELRDLDPVARDAQLKDLAVKSPELARKLAGMLRADENSALVDKDPMPSHIVGAGDFREQDEIGGYVLEELIGSGGMGTVWRARQESPKRTVALKLLRAGLPPAAAQRRFVQEADIMGSLQHPGIAKIHETGIQAGANGEFPFFVMELIDGVPLDAHARQHDLSQSSRISLFTAICDAVDHAHRKGVIHRDLKPANILVTATGQPKILDFGVARVTDSDIAATTILTDVGQLMGTIAYMSPEQTLGRPDVIDQRTDVYALGVILFELLVGRRPLEFSGLSPLKAIRIINDEEPPRLSAFDTAYAGDLEIITAKALEKEKGRRYTDAASLAADLRRHQNHQPILARPTSAAYRIGKFARRNRIVVGSTIAVILALLVGLVAATQGMRRAENSESETADALRNAEESARQSRQSLARYQGIVGFLDETLAAMNPMAAGRQYATLESFVDEVAKGLETRFPGDEESRTVLQTTLGRAYSGIENYQEARRHLSIVLDAHRKQYGSDHIMVAETLVHLARNDASARRLVDARQWIVEAIEIHEDNPGASARGARQAAHTLFGFIEFLGSRYDAARARLEKARSIGETTDWRNDWIAAKIDIVEGNYVRGIAGMEQAAAVSAKTLGEDHPTVAEITMELAECELNAGQVRTAESSARRALDLVASRFGSEFALCFRNHFVLGRVLMVMGRLKDAEKYLRALSARQDELATPETYRSSTLTTLGSVLLMRGKLSESGPILTRAIKSLRASYPEGNYILANALLLGSRQMMAERQPTQALELARESHAMGLSHPFADIDLTTGSNLARLLRSMNEVDEAISIMNEVCRRSSDRHGPAHEDSVPHRVLLGSFLFDDGRMEEAVKELDFIGDMAEPKDPGSRFIQSMGQRSLGSALFKLGEFELAEPHLLAAFEGAAKLGPRGKWIFSEVGRRLIEIYDDSEDAARETEIRRRLANAAGAQPK